MSEPLVCMAASTTSRVWVAAHDSRDYYLGGRRNG
jgi:hypothetical protein